MEFTIKDITISSLVTVLVIYISLKFLAIINPFLLSLPFWTWGISRVILFIIVFQLFMGFVYQKILLMIHKLQPGKFTIEEKSRRVLVWKQLVYSYQLTARVLIPITPDIMRAPAYALLGFKAGKNVVVAGSLIEPYFITMDDNAMVGRDAILSGHAVTKDEVILGHIKIGKDVQIGVQAVIWPDVVIGDNSVVAPLSVVKVGTRIPPNELWGGIPAKKIKNINRPKMKTF